MKKSGKHHIWIIKLYICILRITILSHDSHKNGHVSGVGSWSASC